MRIYAIPPGRGGISRDEVRNIVLGNSVYAELDLLILLEAKVVVAKKLIFAAPRDIEDYP
jgi:hypothetical protein